MADNHARSKRSPRAFSPYLWSTCDQAVASIGNALLLSQLARGMNSRSLGETSLIYTVVLALSQVVRAGTSEVVLSSATASDDSLMDDAALRTIVIALAVPVSLAGLVWMQVPGQQVPALLIVALAVILIQDRLRYEWICRKNMKRAFVMDLVWLVGQLSALGLLGGKVLSPKPGNAVVAWIIGALMSIAFARQLKHLLRLKDPREWFIRNSRRLIASSTQCLVVTVSTLLPMAVFTVLRAPTWLSGFVIASSVTGLQPLLSNAMRPILFRRFAETTESHRVKNLVRTCLLATSASACAGVASLGFMVFLGETVYGSAAVIGTSLTFWLVIKLAIGMNTSIVQGVLRARDRWSLGLRVDVYTIILSGCMMFAAGSVIGPGFVIPFQALASLFSLGICAYLFAKSSTARSASVLSK